MKKIILNLFLLTFSVLSLSQSLVNNSFNLNNDYGDFYMRRYVSGDMVWKRALVAGENELIINFAGDFYNKTVVNGDIFQVDKFMKIFPASNADNNSPGIVFVSGDDFLYDGKYINHYGFGFHDFKDISSPLNGNNSYISGYFGVDFFTSGQNRLRVNHNGNVGIGTVKPDEKLTVNGKIHAKEVRVDLNIAPDYVFQKYYTGKSKLKEDYTMPTLEQVASFTKENHHLPNVPSAKQIQKEGLHLKEMTTILLQKVEELTLYTIEQEKRIKALEAQLSKK